MRTVLSSWKEIAQYLGKGVRTVQRWELELGLPVRRPKPNEKQIVLAFPDELDAWLKHPARPSYSPALIRENNREHREEFVRLRALIHRTMAETKRLQATTEALLKCTERYDVRRDRKAS